MRERARHAGLPPPSREAAVQRYVEELAVLGVAPPSTVPLYYRVDAGLLRGASAIAVMGSDTSGEVEAVLVALADELWVGLGSDHTDRAAGATSVALSKQLCRKPTAGELWCFDEVADHGDELTLRAHRVEAGEHKVYEEGTLAATRPPHDLIAGYVGSSEGGLPVGAMMFCGRSRRSAVSGRRRGAGWSWWTRCWGGRLDTYDVRVLSIGS